MAIPAYMTIEGENQGEISSGALSEDSVGTATQEGHEDEIMIQAFVHNVPRGTNEQSGQITSMPAMKPMKITKFIDKASPLLHNALTTGEQLTVTINWYRISASGEEELYYVMELESSVLVDIETILPSVGDPTMAHLAHMEVLHINPGAITWTHEAAGTEGAYRFGASQA
ncbi:Hcp family type VI secretion system effector [Bermanella sp. R86510]|uniref:Hcp family type VI secretion system effector n=1 Tax=unclassified Bermanella TaxID=2627862 RepID=UPI0037C665E2